MKKYNDVILDLSVQIFSGPTEADGRYPKAAREFEIDTLI